MFPLNYVSPKSGRAVKKEKICSLDHNSSLTSVSRMHVASNGILDCNCQNYSSLFSPCPGPITKPYFMLMGGYGRLRIVAKLLLIPPLNIYHSTAPPTPTATVSKAWFMTRSPSASSERRRVHHSDFPQASVLFHPKAGEGKKEREKKAGRQRANDRWMEKGRTNWRERGRLTQRERKKPASTYLYIKEVTLPCKFAKAHL